MLIAIASADSVPGSKPGNAESSPAGQTVIVEMLSTTDPVALPAAPASPESSTARVVGNAQANARAAQRAALRLIQADGDARVTGFWIHDELRVENATPALIAALLRLPGVLTVRPERTYPTPIRPTIDPASPSPWGLVRIGAEAAWQQGVTGRGVTVATIDTGADITHPSLTRQYRGWRATGPPSNDYNWFDATGTCTNSPCDDSGHGTQVMGTIVGGDGNGPFAPDTGVAPGANWIAAKACGTDGCTEAALLSAAQWILAPTDRTGRHPNPAARPDVVNLSWGTHPDDPVFRDIIRAWHAAGIVTVAAVGNTGPQCATALSPADYPESLAVGATDYADTILPSSARGRATGKITPDVVAPGDQILSPVPGGGYAPMSNTSTAAAHASGAIALLLSARPELHRHPDAVTGLLRSTARGHADSSCGYQSATANNVYGSGRIDVAAALRRLRTEGIVAGTVRVAGTERPMPGALVNPYQASSEGALRAVVTERDGSFVLLLPVGRTALLATASGHLSGRPVLVSIVSGVSKRVDVHVR